MSYSKRGGLMLNYVNSATSKPHQKPTSHFLIVGRSNRPPRWKIMENMEQKCHPPVSPFPLQWLPFPWNGCHNRISFPPITISHHPGPSRQATTDVPNGQMIVMPLGVSLVFSSILLFFQNKPRLQQIQLGSSPTAFYPCLEIIPRPTFQVSTRSLTNPYSYSVNYSYMRNCSAT